MYQSYREMYRYRLWFFVIVWLIVPFRLLGARLGYWLSGLAGYIITWIFLYSSWHTGYGLVPEVIGTILILFLVLWQFLLLLIHFTDMCILIIDPVYVRVSSLFDFIILVRFRLLDQLLFVSTFRFSLSYYVWLIFFVILYIYTHAHTLSSYYHYVYVVYLLLCTYIVHCVSLPSLYYCTLTSHLWNCAFVLDYVYDSLPLFLSSIHLRLLVGYVSLSLLFL